MKLLLIALTFAALTGCAASLDRQVMSSLEPTHEDSTYRHFKFKATANVAHRDEQTRIDWLESWLSDNGLLGAKYEITTRQEVVKASSLFGPVLDIYYTVRVTKPTAISD